jgi:PilZ domain
MRLPDKTVLHPTEGPDFQHMNKDQRPYVRAASAITERRKSSRTAIHRAAYINFEPYNRGGVITDISETGLRFHTVDALEQGGIVRVSIFLGAANQIEAVGELIWKDATRRIGGLRFTVLPPGAANQIRNWAEASNGTNPPSAEVAEPNAPPQPADRHEAPTLNAAPPRLEALSATENQVSKTESEPKSPKVSQPSASQASDAGTRPPWVPRSMRPVSTMPSAQPPQGSLGAGSTPPAQPWAPPAAYQQPIAIPPMAPMPWITHFDPDPPRGSWVFIRGVLGGVIICLILAGAGWFAANHYAGNDGAFQFKNPFGSHPAASDPAVPRPGLPSADVPDVTNDSNPAKSLPPDQSQPAPSHQSSSSTPSGTQPDTQSNLNMPPIPNRESHSAPDSTATAATQSKDAQATTSPQSAVAQAPSAATPAPDILSAARGPAPTASQSDAKAPAAQPARAPDAGESQLTLARQYLDGRSRPRNPAAASQLLWSAVEKGNSLAETDLADLYLRGDGVARNCDQARVLLSAASGKGNPEAMQKLSELNRTGCR